MASLVDLLTQGYPAQVQGLVVGLGNPGSRYEGTRHNIGFAVLDTLAEQHKLRFKLNKGLNAQLALWRLPQGPSVLLVKPLTYMNLSGQAVAPLMQFYDLRPEQLLVVVDDVALNLGQLRLRPKGSAGGQNGLKSIISALQGLGAQYKTQQSKTKPNAQGSLSPQAAPSKQAPPQKPWQPEGFQRLRVGIGPQPNGVPLETFVLEPFPPEATLQLAWVQTAAAFAVEQTLRLGLEPVRNAINGLAITDAYWAEQPLVQRLLAQPFPKPEPPQPGSQTQSKASNKPEA